MHVAPKEPDSCAMACSARAVLFLITVGIASASTAQPVINQDAWTQPLAAQKVKVQVKIEESNGATAGEPNEEDLGQYLVSSLAARNGHLYKMRLQKSHGEPSHQARSSLSCLKLKFPPAWSTLRQSPFVLTSSVRVGSNTSNQSLQCVWRCMCSTALSGRERHSVIS